MLNRVKKAETYINSSNTRDLDYTYNEFGNLTSKTSTKSGDQDVTGYVYGAGAAGPHAVTSASIDGVTSTLSYDVGGTLQTGEVLKYDISGTSDDKYLAYNANNQPTKIVVGSSLTDSTPVAKDEFAYGPNGQRYARKTTWQEGGSTYTESTFYIGTVEISSDNSTGTTKTVTKTKISPNVMHVKIVGTTTEQFYEYAHRDQLGSIEVVTDGSGNVLDNLAFENFGARKKKDWTGNIPSAELDDLLELGTGHSRKARGFTGHEHLDRTGFIHMNGRLYDPTLGRFLSPDPYVQFPTFSQSWNRYSYVNNSPASFTDPTGFFQDLSGEPEGTTNEDGYGGSIGAALRARANAIINAGLLGIDTPSIRGDTVSTFGALPGELIPASLPLIDRSQTDQPVDYGQAVFDLLNDEAQRQGRAQSNARFNRIAIERGYAARGTGLQDAAEVFLENLLNLEGTLTGTAAYGQGVTGDFSLEIDGESATGRVAHTTGAGFFAGLLLEGKAVQFGSLDGFNQAATFSLGVGLAARFSVQWGPRGFQITSAIGAGVGADATIISNGVTASIRKH